MEVISFGSHAVPLNAAAPSGTAERGQRIAGRVANCSSGDAVLPTRRFQRGPQVQPQAGPGQTENADLPMRRQDARVANAALRMGDVATLLLSVVSDVNTITASVQTPMTDFAAPPTTLNCATIPRLLAARLLVTAAPRLRTAAQVAKLAMENASRTQR